MATLVDERILDERLARLEAARPWSPRVVSRLEALIRSDDDAALFRVNPFAFAGQWGLDQDEAIDLFLHASALGLFEMDWLLVCPRCACAVESFARLRAVVRRFRCPECRNEYEAAMDDLIAIYFSVSPQIRAIRYHRPETLDPFDYIYGFKGVREGRMPDGGSFLDAARSALRGIAFLEPGETARFEFEAAPGALWGFSSDSAAGFELQVGSEPTSEPQHVRLTYLGTGYQPNEAALAPGPVALEVDTPTSTRGVLAITQVSPDEEGELLNFDPYLTGKHLLTSQTFRSLFRSEIVGAALDMLGAIERFNEGQPERSVSLKIGIHHGAAIAVTLNDELDYFGQTVNIASRVQEMADAAEIWITEAVWRYPGVHELLDPCPAEQRTAEFRGIEHPMSVVRIGAKGSAAAVQRRPATQEDPPAAKGSAP